MKWMLIDMFVPNNRKVEIAKAPYKFWPVCHKDDIPDDYLVIGFCRHPEDRIISCWKDKVNGKRFHQGFNRRHPGKFHHHMPFNEFVKQVATIPDAEGFLCDQHFRSQTYDLKLNRVDELVRMESIRKDWDRARDMIFNHAKVAYPEIYHRNKTSKKETFEVSPETRKLIEQRYADDYKLLNYESRNSSNP